MEVSSLNNLLPRTSSTNTSSDMADVISEDANFQAALDDATSRLNIANSREITVMSDEEIAQRDEDIRTASVDLEAILLKMMYNEMYKTVPKDELFGDDNAMDIYRDMYNEALTKQMAQGGGIGLADFIYNQLTKSSR